MRSLAFSVVLLTAVFAFAQPKKDVPPKPVPGAPTLTTLVSLGLKRGEAKALTLSGTNLASVSDVSLVGCQPPVTVAIPKDQIDATKLKVLFEIPDATPIGMYQLRVATPNGVSNFRPICIDCVPEVADNGDNNKPDKAQKITWPCVVNGTIAVESADYYRFSVKAGQVVNLDCHARRLGSPLDPVIILHDAKTGRELPALYADDTPGLQSDCRFVHTFKEDGEYLVQVRDSTYKGGADFAYRLRVTSSLAASFAFPPIRLNSSEPISLHATQEGEVIPGWPVSIRESTFPQIVEQEPNDDIKTATKVTLPGGVSARFEKKGDKDFFSFAAKKGQKIEAVCMTAEIGSPTEVHLRILDEAGKELVVSDPQKPAARAEFTAPADGTYYAATEHLNYLFGPGEVYHLTIKPVVPEFDVTIGTDKIDVPEAGFTLLPITGIAKLNGFNGPITITAEGVSCEVTIPASAVPTPANPLYLPVRMKAGVKGIAPFRVIAKGGEFTKRATATDVCRAGLGGLSHLPPGWSDRFVAVEVPAAPIALGWIGDSVLTVGKPAKVKIETERKMYDGEVTLALIGLPANVTAKVKPIAKDEKTAEVEFVADAKAVVGMNEVYVKGTVKTDAGERHIYAGPLTLTIAPAPKKEEPKKEEPKKK